MNSVVSVYADDRTLTELDAVRIRRCIRHAEPDSAPYPPLDDVLDCAAVVPGRQVSADVVTMHSRLRLRLVPGGQRLEVTLCYPGHAAPAKGFVSVLSPLGGALIGLRVGDVAQWSSPDGAPLRAEILELLFQPEASGNYTL
ncbi:MAG TPA: GreA/GreB family elongation factor [Ideonella sp.]|nr:GreA/GreB family elongation factor [Ideonella sp.]